MKNIMLVVLVVLFAACAKEKDEPRCWSCDTVAASFDSSNKLVKREEIRDDTAFCDKTQAQIRKIEQSGSQEYEEINGVAVTTFLSLACRPK